MSKKDTPSGGKKKLGVTKETLKDLRAPKGREKEVRGGAMRRIGENPECAASGSCASGLKCGA